MNYLRCLLFFPALVFLLTATLIFTPEEVRAACSKSGTSCARNTQCQPSGEPDCATYVCTGSARGPGTCKVSSGSGGGSSGSGGSSNAGPKVKACTPGGPQGIDTALGCIPTENTSEFIKWVLRWAIGIAGGIAFLLILSSGFQIMTSAGSPDKLKAGQEQLTAAISGLLFVLFSVFLLKLIGLDILQIPGFGTP